MLSVEQCKKYLKGYNYTDQEIEQIRDSFYQVADILIENYLIVSDNKSKQK